MHRFSGVLLQVYAFDAHQARCSVAQFDEDFALSHNRMIELADLIALRQVRVKVVFAIKCRKCVDMCFEPKPGPHRLRHAFFIDDGQHAGHAGVDKCHI